MIRILFTLVGYLCTATVIAAALGIGYLLQAGRLDDNKMFRAVALLHGVDLNELDAAKKADNSEVPPEETSLKEQKRQFEVCDRNFEVKTLALESGRKEFNRLLGRLEEETVRIDRQSQEIQSLINERKELSTKESVDNVVSNYEKMLPETAKWDLLQMMDENRKEDALVLWTALPPKARKNILKTIETEDEKLQLHEMHRLMLEGYPQKQNIEEAEQRLNSLQSENTN